MYEQIEIEIKVLRDNGNKKPLREMSCVIMVIDLENRLLNIFPAKMGLFGISRELQFTLCNHNSHMQVLPEWGKKHASKEEKNKKGLEKLW